MCHHWYERDWENGLEAKRESAPVDQADDEGGDEPERREPVVHTADD